LYEEAEGHYQAVGNWLKAEDSALAGFYRQIYSQGSFRIGTTVKPVGRDEYDLDLVVELLLDQNVSPKEVLDTLASRLRRSGTYADMVEVLKRCVRLNYAGKFHLDILPAIQVGGSSGTAILVPDRKLQAWLPSDPKGYANWFVHRSRGISLREAAVEPLPGYEPAPKKRSLQLAAQLIKRWRSLAFSDQKEREPRSIVLTTLVGEAYGSEESVSAALTAVLAGISEQIAAAGDGILEVRNPANPEEILSEKWAEDPVAYDLFKSRFSGLCLSWSKIQSASDSETVSATLSELFGEEVKSAYRRQAELLKDSTKFVSPSSGVITGAATTGAVEVKDHTFYGEE